MGTKLLEEQLPKYPVGSPEWNAITAEIKRYKEGGGSVVARAGGKPTGVALPTEGAISDEQYLASKRAKRGEAGFQRDMVSSPWYTQFQEQEGGPPNLDDPRYDYRKAYYAGISPAPNDTDGGRYHWPSQVPGTGEMLKRKDHPTAWKAEFANRTGIDPDTGMPNEEGQRRMALSSATQEKLARGKTPLDRVFKKTFDTFRYHAKAEDGKSFAEKYTPTLMAIPATMAAFASGVMTEGFDAFMETMDRMGHEFIRFAEQNPEEMQKLAFGTPLHPLPNPSHLLSPGQMKVLGEGMVSTPDAEAYSKLSPAGRALNMPFRGAVGTVGIMPRFVSGIIDEVFNSGMHGVGKWDMAIEQAKGFTTLIGQAGYGLNEYLQQLQSEDMLPETKLLGQALDHFLHPAGLNGPEFIAKASNALGSAVGLPPTDLKEMEASGIEAAYNAPWDVYFGLHMGKGLVKTGVKWGKKGYKTLREKATEAREADRLKKEQAFRDKQPPLQLTGPKDTVVPPERQLTGPAPVPPARQLTGPEGYVLGEGYSMRPPSPTDARPPEPVSVALRASGVPPERQLPAPTDKLYGEGWTARDVRPDRTIGLSPTGQAQVRAGEGNIRIPVQPKAPGKPVRMRALEAARKYGPGTLGVVLAGYAAGQAINNDDKKSIVRRFADAGLLAGAAVLGATRAKMEKPKLESRLAEVVETKVPKLPGTMKGDAIVTWLRKQGIPELELKLGAHEALKTLDPNKRYTKEEISDLFKGQGLFVNAIELTGDRAVYGPKTHKKWGLRNAEIKPEEYTDLLLEVAPVNEATALLRHGGGHFIGQSDAVLVNNRIVDTNYDFGDGPVKRSISIETQSDWNKAVRTAEERGDPVVKGADLIKRGEIRRAYLTSFYEETVNSLNSLLREPIEGFLTGHSLWGLDGRRLTEAERTAFFSELKKKARELTERSGYTNPAAVDIYNALRSLAFHRGVLISKDQPTPHRIALARRRGEYLTGDFGAGELMFDSPAQIHKRTGAAWRAGSEVAAQAVLGITGPRGYLEAMSSDYKKPFLTENPWQGSWLRKTHEYAIQRAILNGAERYGWAKGDTVRKRYDLAEAVNKLRLVEIETSQAPVYDLYYEPAGETHGKWIRGLRRRDLPEYVGENLADRLVSSMRWIDGSGRDLDLFDKDRSVPVDPTLPKNATRDGTMTSEEIGSALMGEGEWANTQYDFDTKNIVLKILKQFGITEKDMGEFFDKPESTTPLRDRVRNIRGDGYWDIKLPTKEQAQKLLDLGVKTAAVALTAKGLYDVATNKEDKEKVAPLAIAGALIGGAGKGKKLEARAKKIAEKNGAKYKGMQENAKGEPAFFNFTEKTTGSDFLVKRLEDVPAKAKAVRDKFAKAEAERAAKGSTVAPEVKAPAQQDAGSTPAPSTKIKITEKSENFTFGGKSWDVNKAKQAIIDSPRGTVTLNVKNIRGMLDDGMIGTKRSITEKADPSVPVIITAKESNGQWIVVDGWHRIKKAIESGQETIQAYRLSPRESVDIRRDIKTAEAKDELLKRAYGNEATAPPIKVEAKKALDTGKARETVEEIRKLGDRNPLNERQTIIDEVKVQVEQTGDMVTIKSIESMDLGKGKGSTVLKKILDTAEKNGVDVVVTPERIGMTPKAKLVKWYKDHGFMEWTQGRMIRRVLEGGKKYGPVALAAVITAKGIYNYIQGVQGGDKREPSPELAAIFLAAGLVRRRKGESVVPKDMALYRKNIEKGIEAARGGGYTFDPRNYKAFNKDGYIISVAGGKIAKADLTPEAVHKLATKYKKVLNTFKDANIGIWFDEATGDLFLDVNVRLARTPEGLRLARALGDISQFNQREIGELGPGGAYVRGIKAGGTGERPSLAAGRTIQAIDAIADIVKKFPTEENLVKLFKEGDLGVGWYKSTLPMLKKLYPKDWLSRSLVLAWTSQYSSLDTGGTLTIKADARAREGYDIVGKWVKHPKTGKRVWEPITRDRRMDKRVDEFLKTGKVPASVKRNRKLYAFWRAIMGDKNAVVVDRWIARAWLGKEVDSVGPREYSLIEAEIRRLSKEAGVSPAEFQEAVWTGMKLLHETKGYASRGIVPHFGQAYLRKIDEAWQEKRYKGQPTPPDMIALVRFSPVKLGKKMLLDPSKPKQRTGAPGKEAERMDLPDFMERLYTYTLDAKPEKGVIDRATQVYQFFISRSRIYDLTKDPDGIVKQAEAKLKRPDIIDPEGRGRTAQPIDPEMLRNLTEKLVRAKGYAGFSSGDWSIVGIFEPMKGERLQNREKLTINPETVLGTSLAAAAWGASVAALMYAPNNKEEWQGLLDGVSDFMGITGKEAQTMAGLGLAGMGLFGSVRRGKGKTKGKEAKRRPLNLDHMDISPDAKAKIREAEAALADAIERATGAPITHGEVLEAAKKTGALKGAMSRQQILEFEAQGAALRQQVAKDAKDMAEGKPLTTEAAERLVSLASLNKTLGSGLQSLGIDVDPAVQTARSKIIQEVLSISADLEKVTDAWNKIDKKDFRAVADFYREHFKPTLMEKVDELRYINLLSSPRTHIINAVSNLLQVGVLRPAVMATHSGIDYLQSKMTGAERTQYVSELGAYGAAAIGAFPAAWASALDALRGKIDIERPDLPPMPTQSKVLKPFYIIPRALEAGDVFFRTISADAEMAAMVEKARKSGKKIDLDEARANAELRAKEVIFRKMPDPENKTGQGWLSSQIDRGTMLILRGRKSSPFQLVKWFVPFVMTPMNIFKQGLEHSPVGLLNLKGSKNKGEVVSKAFVGSVVLGVSAGFAAAGLTTWAAPKGKKQKEEFYAAGMQPYSIKIGDTWWSYSKLGPLSYPIAMAAAIKYNFSDQNKDMTIGEAEKLWNTLLSVGGFFADQSYVQGIGDLVDFMRGEGNATRIVSNVPRQLIPLSAFQGWVNRIIDPNYRKTENFWQEFQNSLIGGPQGYPLGIPAGEVSPYKTPSGQPATRGELGTRIGNAISPFAFRGSDEKKAGQYKVMLLKRQMAAVNDEAREKIKAGDLKGAASLIKRWNTAHPTITLSYSELYDAVKKKRESDAKKKAKGNIIGEVPAGMEVEVPVYHARTGKTVMIKEDARDAMTDVESRLSRLSNLLEYVNA